MEQKQTVKVWDIGVRLFHWTLVTAFIIAFATHEDVGDLHIFAGYVVTVLVIFRIIWGFVGSRHARFSDFVRSPAVVLKYLLGLFTGKVEHYLGHNPAGGWMVVVLLLSLSVLSYTGLKAYGVEGGGPLAAGAEISLMGVAHAHEQERHEEGVAHFEGEEEEGFWHEVHEASSDITLALIFIHLLGVVVASRLHREKLVKAMITGYKDKQ